MRKLNVNEFLVRYGSEKVYYDPTFQRRVVWTSKDRNKYFEALSKGRARTNLTVMDIEPCLEYSKKKGDLPSETYFRDKLDQGFRYISLDGQNRSKQIEMFINNKVEISGGFRDSKEHSVVIDNKFFKDLPEALQDKIFLMSQLFVDEVENATKSEASEIFRELNSGVALNSQEKRNAHASPVAGVVRKISKKHEEVSLKILQKDKIKRMEDDEFYAKVLMVLIRKYNLLNKKQKPFDLASDDIDQFYNLGVNVAGGAVMNIMDENSPYIPSEIDRAEDIIDMARLVFLSDGAKKDITRNKVIARHRVWAIIYACEWAYDKEHMISDYSEFFRQLKEIDIELFNSSKVGHANELQQAAKNGVDISTIKDSKFYFRWQPLVHQAAMRLKRKNALIEQIETNKSRLTLRLNPSVINKAA